MKTKALLTFGKNKTKTKQTNTVKTIHFEKKTTFDTVRIYNTSTDLPLINTTHLRTVNEHQLKTYIAKAGGHILILEILLVENGGDEVLDGGTGTVIEAVLLQEFEPLVLLVVCLHRHGPPTS